MGLFDRFRKKKEPEIQRDPEEALLAMHVKGLTDGINEIMTTNLTRYRKIAHSDGSRTNLVFGRISKYRTGDTVFFDAADYIAFEVPEGTKVTEAMLDEAIRQYDINKRIASSGERAFYVGRMQEAMGKVFFGNKSTAVENIVKDEVNKLEQARGIQVRETIERNERLRQEEQRKAREQDEIRRREYNAIRDRERAQRKSNPYLTSLGSYTPSGKTYTDYDGIDTVKGDFLRLRQVDKVCKDASGTYLYSAYVDRTSNEHNAEYLGEHEPAGSFVCFTLPGRLEDIVKSGDQTRITQVLDLLSDPRNFENEGHLTYIGGITQGGYVNHTNTPPSPDFASRIKRMQDEYEARRASYIQKNARNLYDDDAR